MTDIVTAIVWLAGSAFALLAAVGVLRMPDVFTRMQASTKASTLGLALSVDWRGVADGRLRVIHPSREHRSVRVVDDAGVRSRHRPGFVLRRRSAVGGNRAR